MKNRLINNTGFVWVLSVLLLLVCCAKDAEETTGNIYGKITDAQTSEVLQGVTVTITPGGLSRTTGSDGNYEFNGLEPGSYQIQAKKSGYVTNTKGVNVVIGKTASGDVSLSPEVKAGKLELSADALNFGKSNSSLSFDIKNSGNAKFNWNISGLDKADWLEVNPASGALDAGKSCVVQVAVLREKLTESKELTLIVNADKESASLKVTVEAEAKTSKIAIEPSSLDFGTDESVLTFNVKNIGNKGSVDWNITGLDVDWITIAPMSGTVEQEKTQAVKVTLARALVKDHVKATVLVNADGESLPLEIMADEQKARWIEADPNPLDLGSQTGATLTLRSYNGSSSYTLVKKTEADWLTLSKSSGTIPQYDAANPAMKETVEMTVSRAGLTAGDYSCTLAVRSSGLEELEIPVTMKVKESEAKLEVSPVVIDFGREKNQETFTVKNVGNTGSFDWNISNLKADWVTAAPTSGTLAMGKSATVTLSLNRALVTGAVGTSLDVNIAGETVTVAISAEAKPQREFKVQPTSIAIGTAETSSFTMYSTNGPTAYQLLTKENVAWLSFSKTTGTVPDGTPETITLRVNRESLAAGNYSCTIIARTDLGDTEIPVTMTVEEQTGPTGSGTILSCSDNLEFTLVGCKMSGTTAVIDFKVKNTGNATTTLQLQGGNSNSATWGYDDQGTRYYGSNVRVGLGATETEYNTVTDLPSDVFSKGCIKIKNVTDATSLFSYIRIATNQGEYLVLKDIAIEGRTAVPPVTESLTTGTITSCHTDLKFILLDCKRGVSETVISFYLKNTGDEMLDLKLSGGSSNGGTYAYDDQGNKYANSALLVGLDDVVTNYNVTTTMPPSIFTYGSVHIKNVDAAATEFTNVTVVTNGDVLILKNVKIRQ